MTASSRGTRAAASMIRATRSTRTYSHSHPLICSECISYLTPTSMPASRISPLGQRTYAIAATSLKTDDAAPNSSLPHLQRFPPVATTSGIPEYIPKAGILLSRPPLITARQTSFEKAFFFYQKRLNERLAMPFQPYFYFKSDTPADTDRKIKARERNGAAARELGGYRAYGDQAWNDELLSSESSAAPDIEGLGKLGLAEPKHIVESLIKDARVRAVEGKDGAAVEVKEGEERELAAGEIKVERPLARRTESDQMKDKTRLDRALDRTLYLLVQQSHGLWGFPVGGLEGRENLHQAAERIIVQTAGMNMNTWVVGKVPVGHYVLPPQYSEDKSQLVKPGEKQFFLKGRIMAGQADITGNAFGVRNFKWLTKEEVGKHVKPRYFASVKDMLADR
ncbi:hypothetical protein LZ554_007679 [Drepanopeziza brunnea f. sp. 'monogermtubi']|nr:hypothetical protein LZ554_007679 [Drepanopeziza brunnea f. sp. 'monogermtubi']